MSSTEPILLRIRPSVPDDDAGANRGPLMMETVLSTVHSLKGAAGRIALEIGLADGKIGLFMRARKQTALLLESQMYGQYPDAEIDEIDRGTFKAKKGEIVVSSVLTLTDPEVFPIRRYPQFSDASTKQNIDTIAGVTSTLVRYGKPGMRGHVQLIIEPADSKLRKRGMKLMPFLDKGLVKHWDAYGNLFAKLHMATGGSRGAMYPVYILMGGWKFWFSAFRRKSSISLLTGEETAKDDVADKAKISARNHDREDNTGAAVDKLQRMLFRSSVRISVIAPADCQLEAVAKLQEIASSFRQFTQPTCNGFAMTPPEIIEQIPEEQIEPYALSAEEVATLWHIPSVNVKTPNMDVVISKKLEPPVNLPVPGITDAEENLTVLGESVFHGQRMQFGIRPDDRRRHVYIIGKTGMGKSTLLENMIFSDIVSGKGIGVIDPHGDLIEAILRFTPKHRINDVVLFDPADRDFPVAFNMLEAPDPNQRALISSGLMSVFTKLWPEAFSGRMEHILRNTLLALLDNEGSSMLGILRMFGDDAFREKIVSNIQDTVVKAFWETEYAGWTDKYRTEAVAAIQNKIGQLLTTPVIRNIVGQSKSTLDIRHAMDTGKIVLVNLSKGKIGEDTSAFLGSMLVTKFQIDAMSRADIPEKDRRDFYLYVDEFQNFATKSFATILSEARKYRLALTMAHQYVGQLTIGQGDTSLRDAVFGNVGSMVSFQIGSDDAESLSLQFEEMVSPKDILSLPKYQAYVRLMIDGIPSKPFSVATLAPPKFELDMDRVETLRALSRERYAQKRADVEERILRWASNTAGMKPTVAKPRPKTGEKAKEKEEEEIKKAKAKKMTLEQYRAWRDREMWTNEYNALRKRMMLGEALAEGEVAIMQELEQKLEAGGGVPPVSKSMLDAVEKAKKATTGEPAA